MRIPFPVVAVGMAMWISGCTTPRQAGVPGETVQRVSEHRTVTLEAKSKTEQSEMTPRLMSQWQREGWSVLSVSAPETLPDGGLRWKAELERKFTVPVAQNGYDDLRIARIERGQTTGQQLVDWFGPPTSREVAPDGRARLSWHFSSRGTGGRAGSSGMLEVKLAPDGKVEAYSARQNPAP